jgi:hypothetical protein
MVWCENPMEWAVDEGVCGRDECSQDEMDVREDEALIRHGCDLVWSSSEVLQDVIGVFVEVLCLVSETWPGTRDHNDVVRRSESNMLCPAQVAMSSPPFCSRKQVYKI